MVGLRHGGCGVASTHGVTLGGRTEGSGSDSRSNRVPRAFGQIGLAMRMARQRCMRTVGGLSSSLSAFANDMRPVFDFLQFVV